MSKAENQEFDVIKCKVNLLEVKLEKFKETNPIPFKLL